LTPPPQPRAAPARPAPDRQTEATLRITEKPSTFLGFKTLQICSAHASSSFPVRHDTRDLATGVESGGVSRTTNSRHSSTWISAPALFNVRPPRRRQGPHRDDHSRLMVHQCDTKSPAPPWSFSIQPQHDVLTSRPFHSRQAPSPMALSHPHPHALSRDSLSLVLFTLCPKKFPQELAARTGGPFYTNNTREGPPAGPAHSPRQQKDMRLNRQITAGKPSASHGSKTSHLQKRFGLDPFVVARRSQK